MKPFRDLLTELIDRYFEETHETLGDAQQLDEVTKALEAKLHDLLEGKLDGGQP